MIAGLLLLVLAAWITWVLFRDRESAEKAADPVRSQELDDRDRGQRADE